MSNFGPPQEATFRETYTKAGADGCMFSQEPYFEFSFVSKMQLYTLSYLVSTTIELETSFDFKGVLVIYAPVAAEVDF